MERRGPKPFLRLKALAEVLLLQGLLVAVAHAAGLGTEVVMPPGASAASGIRASVPPSSQAADLYLEVQLNGGARGLHVFQEERGTLWAPVATLRALDFVLPVELDGPVRLEALPGVQADFDASRQRLVLTAPLSLLALQTTVLQTDSIRSQPATASPGLLLNYDLYGTRDRRGNSSASAFGELRAFAGRGVFSSTALAHRTHSDARGWQSQSTRLDSSWSLSWPEEMLTLRMGATVTGSLPWSRATRIGGVQLARNFDLQPYRSTAPLPSFIGSATLPSDVELFVNGIRQYTGQVPAGPFALNTLPMINSTGQAQVVLTDALGRATTLSFALNETGRLLADGLSDWSVDLGAVRRNYGLRSFDYGRDVVATGTWRRGLSDSFTLETHGEATRGLTLAGVGGVWRMGSAGLLSAAVAHSAHGAGSGTQTSLGYSWMRGRFHVSASGTRTQGDYRDVAALYDAAPARGTARASVGYSMAELGSVNLSYLYLRPAAEAASRYATLSWSRPLGRSASVSVGFNQNLDQRKQRSLYVGLNWSLDSRLSLGAGVQRDQGRTSTSVSAQRAAPNEGGWGWRAQARGGAGVGGGQAELDYQGRYGRVQAGVSDSGGDSRAAYAGASGALVWLGGGGFASRRVDDAFAVVTTEGVPDVPVKLENRLIGQTDARGLLLVVPVHAYQNNRVGIDPMRLPADVRIDRTETLFTPSDRAGSLVRFGITPVRAASVQLVDGSGQPLPLGSRVQLNDRAGEGALVGYDGLVYLDALEPANTLVVQTPTGLCRTPLTWTRPESGLAQIGPLPCLP